MKKMILIVSVVFLVFSLLTLAGCNSGSNKSTESNLNTKPESQESDITNEDSGTEAESSGDNFELLPIVDDETDEVQKVSGVGPNGETPESLKNLLKMLTPEDEQKVKSGNYTAVICMHTTTNDWSQLQIKGIKATLEKYNIKLLAITDAELKTDKQISDYESVIQMKPDMIVTLPNDKDAVVPILRQAREQGIVLSFIDNVPNGFKSPDDYTGMGTADNYNNGRVSAEILVDEIGEKGKVAILRWKTSLFHADERLRGAEELFAKYPDIEVVSIQGIESAEESASVTESILIANPDLDGIWTVWDGAGMAAAGVAKNLGKKVAITTVDLSEDSGYSIASGGLLIGTGAQHPYDQGVAEAMLGIVALAGKVPPAYVLVPAEKVTRDSIERAWNRVFKEPLLEEIKEAWKN